MTSSMSNTNKMLALVGALVVLAMLARTCQAGLFGQKQAAPLKSVDDPTSDDYQDDMTRAVKVIWNADKTPAGFDRTQAALVTILNELSAPDVRQMGLPKELEDTRIFASAYLAACELSRPRCPFYKQEIDRLESEVDKKDDVNKIPYLETCKLAHKQFCEGLGSGDSAKQRVWADVKKQVRQLEKQRAN